MEHSMSGIWEVFYVGDCGFCFGRTKIVTP